MVLRRPESASILAERHRRQPGEVMALVGWKWFDKMSKKRIEIMIDH
jgi:hypothetical protein